MVAGIFKVIDAGIKDLMHLGAKRGPVTWVYPVAFMRVLVCHGLQLLARWWMTFYSRGLSFIGVEPCRAVPILM
jgi:hypothetical protein